MINLQPTPKSSGEKVILEEKKRHPTVRLKDKKKNQPDEENKNNINNFHHVP